MKIHLFRRWKPPYSQHEISEQIGQIAKLMQLHDKAKHDDKDRAAQAVEAGQEVLNYMLDEVREWQNGRK